MKRPWNNSQMKFHTYETGFLWRPEPNLTCNIWGQNIVFAEIAMIYSILLPYVFLFVLYCIGLWKLFTNIYTKQLYIIPTI